MISYKLFNFDVFANMQDEKRHRGNPGHFFDFSYLSGIHTMDTETSVVTVDNKKHSLVYLWQICINGDTYYGRRIEDFKDFIENICESIPTGKRLVLWVHNLGYEFQHIKDFLSIHDVFMRTNRQPMRATIDEKIELRCSYALTNCSLEDFCKKMNVKNKIKGFNYDKLRTPDTELTDDEMEYAETDCTSLREALMKQFDIYDDNLYSVPWTASGYARRDLKRALHPMQKNIAMLKPSYELFNQMQKAFRGGLCDCNNRRTDRLIHDVVSFDETSAYIYSILCKKFPMRAFKKYDIKTNGSPDFDRWSKIGRCWISDVRIWGLKAKNENIRYLDMVKCESIGCKDIFGKITEAEYLETTLTDVDFENVKKCYDFKKIKFENMQYSIYDMLPECVRNLALQYFVEKTKLKNTDKESEYTLAKERLNTIYGIMVQNLFRDQIVYDEENCTYSTQHKNNEEIYKKTKVLMPYQWGVWTSAHARSALIDAMVIVGDDLLYNDTDSVKFIRNETIMEKIEELNNTIIENAKQNNAFAVDSNGTVHYVGKWLIDAEYIDFKTLAPKMYAGKTDSGISITISGINKKSGSQSIQDVDDITWGFTFPKECSKFITYNDLDKCIEWNGFRIYSNMVITNYEHTLQEDEI